MTDRSDKWRPVARKTAIGSAVFIVFGIAGAIGPLHEYGPKPGDDDVDAPPTADAEGPSCARTRKMFSAR